MDTSRPSSGALPRILPFSSGSMSSERRFREVGEDPEIAVKVNRVVQVTLERRQVVDSVTRAPQRRVGAFAMHGKPEVEG